MAASRGLIVVFSLLVLHNASAFMAPATLAGFGRSMAAQAGRNRPLGLAKPLDRDSRAGLRGEAARYGAAGVSMGYNVDLTGKVRLPGTILFSRDNVSKYARSVSLRSRAARGDAWNRITPS